jgi:hypothetical protein
MKLKMIVVDVEPTRAQKRLLKIGVPALFLATASVALAGVPHTFTAGQTVKAMDMNDNFNALDMRLTTVEALPTVVAASATNTGNVPPNTAAFTDIPGMSVTINLAKASLVQFNAIGTQRTTDTNATTICHVGYRYVVDGAPMTNSDPTWGQHINVSNGAYTWHSTWAVAQSATLAAGMHTIKVQAVNPSPNGGCYVCAESNGTQTAYDSCTLNVNATSQ